MVVTGNHCRNAELMVSLLSFPRRGLIMGIWNSHTSVGNILGSLIAGVWVSSAWGLSFIVPGIIIAIMGIVCLLFLVECEWRTCELNLCSVTPSCWETGRAAAFC